MADCCAFDKVLSRNVPHILEKIFFSLDYDSYKKCCEVNSTWKQLIASKPFQKRAKYTFLDWQKTDKKNETKLLEFAEYGNNEEVESLLLIGTNPNCQTGKVASDEGGKTPLHLASINNHINMVTLLLKAEADPNIPDMRCETALFGAISNNEMVKVLLEGGANPNCANDGGETPLYWAASYNQIEVVNLLLKNGADPNMADFNGGTPLSEASWKGQHEVVKVLLEAGAKPDTPDSYGSSPLY